jgi:uncharacterized protein (TIGR02597 family)
MKFSNSIVARSLAASLFFAAIATLPAQSVVTDPVGFTTLTVAAKPAAARGFSYLAMNMTRPTVFRSLIPAGGVSASGAPTVLTFPANTFTAGQFTGTGNACYIEFLNTANAGVISDITASTTNTITLADDVSSLLTAGTTTFKIRPHWTIGTVFGANNSAGLFGATTASAADNIQIQNATTGVKAIYFYNTSAAQWRNNFTDATNVVIPPDVGLIIERKVTSAVSFTLVGEVKLGNSELAIVGGNAIQNVNIVPNPYPLNSVTLATSNLFTGSASTGVVGGTTASAADTLGIFNSGTGIITTYFYNTTAGQWRNNFTDSSSVVIPEGASVIITRKSGRPSFNWYVPQPTMNLN